MSYPRKSSVEASLARRSSRPRRGAATITSDGPQPLLETAYVLPGVVMKLFRAATAGFGIFCLLQWSSLRGVRKQVEEVQEEARGKAADRAERLERLQPKAPPRADEEE